MKVLENITLEVSKGEKVLILGGNGSGKSTLFNIASGLLPPLEGSVRILYKNAYPRNPEIYRKVGLITHNPFLFRNMTVMENLIFFSKIYGCEHKSIIKKMNLQKLLFLNVGDLSEGQRRRVDFARCLIYNPPLLILDEPFSNLDDKWIKKISKMIEKKTILMMSLEIPKYMKFAKIYKLRNGSIGAENV